MRVHSIGKQYLLSGVCLLFSCLLSCGIVLYCDAAPASIGLVKSGGRYFYYDKNGEKICSAWKTVKGRRYYFGKNGAAYQGTKAYGGSRVRIAKIGNDTYAFDVKARMMTFKDEPGILFSKGKFYVFKRNGKLNRIRTKKLRALTKPGTDVTVLVQQLALYGASMIKDPYYYDDVSGCYSVQGESGGYDGVFFYKNFCISVFKGNSGSIYLESVQAQSIE